MNGGDIIEISYNNPDVGSGVWSPKAQEDNEYDIGGIRTNDDEAMITSKGEAIYSLTNKRWKCTVVVTSDMNVRQEYEKTVAMAASLSETTFSFLHINGTIYKGKGRPVGDIKLNVNQSTFTLMLSGSNTLTQ